MPRNVNDRRAAPNTVRVLHVGSDRRVVATALDDSDRRTALWSVETRDEALARLREEAANCLVIELDGSGDALDPIRSMSERGDEPVVALDVTGKATGGAEALSAGAAEYVDGSGPDASALLRHRIEGVIDDRRGRVQNGTESIDDIVRNLNGIPDGLYAADADGRIQWWNEAFADLLDADGDALAGTPVDDVIEENGGDGSFDATKVADRATTTETVLHRADGRVPVEVKRGVIEDGDGTTVVGVVRDISNRRDRRERLDEQDIEIDRQEAEIDRQETEIDRRESEVVSLTRLNAAIRDLDQAFMEAETREKIEQAVCNRLADSDPYTLAWVGERNMSTEGIDPKAWAGIRDEAIEGRTIPVDGSNPIQMTLENKEVRVVEGIEETSRLGPWTGVANEDAQFAVAIPLLYGSVAYGVLVVYTDRPFRFDERELTVLKEHGEAIGHAINTVQQKRALVTDTVTEFQFRMRDADNFYATVSAETDAVFTVEGLVTQTDGSYVEYVTMTGADGNEVLSRAESSDGVDHVHLVNRHRDECLFEFQFDELSIATALADHGASVQTATFENGTGTVMGALPHSSDIRMLAEAFEQSFPGAELVAQRDRERSIQTQQKFHETLEDRLTDRQHAALQTAYLSGYFEWPRDSTGEEVATSLDITPPTFSKHLRVGQRKLLATLFDEERS